MNDTQKMLQAIIHGQNALKQKLVGKIDKVDKKVDALGDRLDGKIDSLGVKLDGVEKNLTGRIDKLGRQLAYLEDDTNFAVVITRSESSSDVAILINQDSHARPSASLGMTVNAKLVI